MFHLTRYKYIFFAISGLIILPGLLALGFWHLNLGIDFTGGMQAELRFQSNSVTVAQVQNAFVANGAKDVHVFALVDKNANLTPQQYIYITLDRPIGQETIDTITARLKDAKNKLPAVTLDKTTTDMPGADGKHISQVVVHFASAVPADTVKGILKDLPATALPTGDATATPTVAPTAAPTSAAKTTPTATATPAPAAPPVPVNVTSVKQGENTNIYRVETHPELSVPALNTIVFKLAQQTGPVYVQSKTLVGASVGQQTTFYAILAVIAASVAIMAYIAIAFRRAGSLGLALRFGVSAIVSLLHDVLVLLGIWAILGHLFDFKVDALFLTAVMTVIGFSVHDTIVVFDRTRENMTRRTSETFDQIVDASLLQTMARSLNTSLTVLITLTALTLFGGASIREFTLALLIGILSGTYSSIFNASMLLVVLQNGEWRTWFRRKSPTAPAQARRELAGTRS